MEPVRLEKGIRIRVYATSPPLSNHNHLSELSALLSSKLSHFDIATMSSAIGLQLASSITLLRPLLFVGIAYAATSELVKMYSGEDVEDRLSTPGITFAEDDFVEKAEYSDKASTHVSFTRLERPLIDAYLYVQLLVSSGHISPQLRLLPCPQSRRPYL